jgi:hypothetical protein
VLDGARQAPLSEDDYEKLKEALHALAAMLVRPRNTEKTSAAKSLVEKIIDKNRSVSDVNEGQYVLPWTKTLASLWKNRRTTRFH